MPGCGMAALRSILGSDRQNSGVCAQEVEQWHRPIAGGVRAVFALFLCAIAAAAVFYAIYLVTHDERFEPQAAAPEQRPAAGWAVPAEGEDADGAGLVHLTLTWRDWEPQEGAYDAEA